MAKKPQRLDFPASHPLIQSGFIHELDVLDAFGVSWSTWERDYRTRIPGRTTPNGRWYHRDHLIAWWSISVSSTDDHNQSPID